MKNLQFYVAVRSLVAAWLVLSSAACLAALPDTVVAVKPSIVGIGNFLPTRSPATMFFGTGFVVGDGLSVITNAHVVQPLVAATGGEQLGILTGSGQKMEFRPATLVAVDREHDLAHVRISGKPLPALKLAPPDQLREGEQLAFTGFPLGTVLGLNAATHRGSLAAIAPIVLPSAGSSKLSAGAINKLRRTPFAIYQLDATAYPGNSGSPVYHPETGEVHAVINMVFIKGLKESAISAPSGITYAIPVSHVRALMEQK